MNEQDKSAVVEAILTRAAENLGDITRPVMDLYYRRFPHARRMFEHHGSGNTASLEGEMVEQSLYCLMNWFDSPGEVSIVLGGSVPHHSDTLGVPPDLYQGLLSASADIIAESIPPENDEEQEVWRELSDELGIQIGDSSKFCRAS